MEFTPEQIKNAIHGANEDQRNLVEKLKTEEHFQIKVWQKEGWYLATVKFQGQEYITQGRNEEEIWRMIADLVLTVKSIPTHWWNSWLYKLMVYPKE